MKLPTSGTKHVGGGRIRVLHLLREGVGTVNELAAALGLTPNAIRSHLALLEKQRLIRKCGWKTGVRRPHAAYELTPRAEELFSSTYAKVFNQLVAELRQRLGQAGLESLFHNTGSSLASASPSKERSRQKKIREAVNLLRGLGGNVRVERCNGSVVLRGTSCPLAAVVAENREACHVVEGLLRTIVRGDVKQRCHYGAKPRCCFEISSTKRVNRKKPRARRR
jgi:predicted ArsR family transcriptional regulator